MRVGGRFRGAAFRRGNPSDRAWRRGHLPLTREANCRAGLVANRETMIRALLRTRVGADSISARSAAPQTPPGRIWNPPLQWFFQCCSQPGNHDPRVTANLCRGRCLHRPAPRGGANTPGGRSLPEGAQGKGMPRPQTLRRREHLRVGLAPLSKGAGCGESRRLGDCLKAGSRSRKAAQGGYFAGGQPLPGAAFRGGAIPPTAPDGAATSL